MQRGLRSGKFSRLNNRGIIVLGLVHSRRYWPHPHGLGGEWSRQVMRVRLVAEPAAVVAVRKYKRHTVVNLGH